MKPRLIVVFLFFTAGLICRSTADNTVVVDASANNLLLDTAPGATLTRDVWGDTWFPEWNTLGDSVGYRNDNPDPNLPAFSLAGNVLTATKVIDATGGEDRWDRGALLVFGYDGTQYVRFGIWSSPGGGALKGTPQTLTFTVPNWVKGQILYEYWTWYGAVNNIDNWFFDATNSNWVKQDLKSHLARSFGNTGLDVTTIIPQQLSLKQTPSSPSGSITASNATITLGDSVTFALSESGADNAGITFTGDAVDLTTPPSSVPVTPDAVGAQNYLLTVPGSVVLNWQQPNNGNTVTLTTPTGNLDVTSVLKYVVTASHGGPGVYSVIQTTPWGKSSDPQPINVTLPNPFTVTALVNVTGPAVVTVNPQSATYTVANGIAAGHTYPRSWSDGSGWHAYLGRDGVMINVSATGSASGISQIELQGKTPTGDWADLVPAQAVDASLPNGAGVTVSQSFSLKLGTDQADKPLIPTDSSLAGTWQLRARALTSSGQWSGWSPSTPLSVEMPIATVTKTGQTLPPVEDAAWYIASEVKTYTFKVWVP